MRKYGTIYQTESGQIALSLKKDQLPNFSKYKMVFLRYFDDVQCTKPTVKNGKKVIGVKHRKELKAVGFLNKKNEVIHPLHL